MSDDLRISITKLSMDGLNWVTYHDRMIWAFSSHHWSEHLTTSALPARYTLAGDINGQTPQDHWNAEEAGAKQLIQLPHPFPTMFSIGSSPRRLSWKSGTHSNHFIRPDQR